MSKWYKYNFIIFEKISSWCKRKYVFRNTDLIVKEKSDLIVSLCQTTRCIAQYWSSNAQEVQRGGSENVSILVPSHFAAVHSKFLTFIPTTRSQIFENLKNAYIQKNLRASSTRERLVNRIWSDVASSKCDQWHLVAFLRTTCYVNKVSISLFRSW